MSVKDKQNLEALKKVHDATNNAVVVLEKRNLELEQEIIKLKAQIVNATNNLMIQKTIVANQIQQSAATEADLVKEIQELKAELKKAKAG